MTSRPHPHLLLLPPSAAQRPLPQTSVEDDRRAIAQALLQQAVDLLTIEGQVGPGRRTFYVHPANLAEQERRMLDFFVRRGYLTAHPGADGDADVAYDLTWSLGWPLGMQLRADGEGRRPLIGLVAAYLAEQRDAGVLAV